MVLQEARLPHLERLRKQLVMNDNFRDVLGAHATLKSLKYPIDISWVQHDFCQYPSRLVCCPCWYVSCAVGVCRSDGAGPCQRNWHSVHVTSVTQTPSKSCMACVDTSRVSDPPSPPPSPGLSTTHKLPGTNKDIVVELCKRRQRAPGGLHGKTKLLCWAMAMYGKRIF
jgi:hypothetical protein